MENTILFYCFAGMRGNNMDYCVISLTVKLVFFIIIWTMFSMDWPTICPKSLHVYSM